MKLNISVNYQTHPGEELRVNVRLANGGYEQYRMQSLNGYEWTASLSVVANDDIHYYYCVCRMDTEIRHEWNLVEHSIDAESAGRDTYVCHDIWQDMPEDSYLYSSAFTDCIQRREHVAMPDMACRKMVLLKVRAPQLGRGEKLYLVGEGGQLGDWRSDRATPMYERENNEWITVLDVSTFISDSITFKFIIKKDNGDTAIVWEDGGNRVLTFQEMTRNEVHVYELPRAFFPGGNMKYAGTAVPIFSLRSEGSFGVGDFGDLQMMIDWVEKTGQRLLQILPINDTTLTHTWTDSYPYSCISIFALHPMYADLRQLPALQDETDIKEFETLRQELNALKQIDYERVNNAKNAYLRLIFAQEGKKMLATDDFKAWFAEEQQWLVPYAQYSVLRDKYGTPNYTEWPDHNVWNEKDRKALTSTSTKAYKEASYFYFMQYVLATQMKAAHDHARRANVVLKGDIPIGVNRYGCDAWMEPRYFNLNGQAGAPPDSFSVNGQNWGFPTYNWDEMLKDDCAWWVRRFSNMAKYFDAYRIDHVLGFFRIWEIPVHAVHGLLGQFQPALGMTRAEVEGYGLFLSDEQMFEPLITDWILERWLGEKANYVRETFLEPTHDEQYRMKPEFDTQRKVEAWFEANGRRDENGKLWQEDETVRDTLYSLISNVLFLHDHKDESKCHPRISAQLDPCYENLWGNDKESFNRLYNDYFYRRNNHFWYLEAMKKLPRLVNATRMLVCAEDLGMVPDCVPWVMNELKILSLEIQNMPKETGLTFGKLKHNPYRSVCTISSHDTATMRMWWDEDAELTQEYYRTRLHRGDNAPHPLPGWLARDIIYRHLTCPSMLCILTLQDWLATDEKLRLADANAERINIPANPKHYWRYRMHLTLEDLLESDEFNYSLEGLIKETGR